MNANSLNYGGGHVDHVIPQRQEQVLTLQKHRRVLVGYTLSGTAFTYRKSPRTNWAERPPSLNSIPPKTQLHLPDDGAASLVSA